MLRLARPTIALTGLLCALCVSTASADATVITKQWEEPVPGDWKQIYERHSYNQIEATAAYFDPGTIEPMNVHVCIRKKYDDTGTYSPTTCNLGHVGRADYSDRLGYPFVTTTLGEWAEILRMAATY